VAYPGLFAKSLIENIKEAEMKIKKTPIPARCNSDRPGFTGFAGSHAVLNSNNKIGIRESLKLNEKIEAKID